MGAVARVDGASLADCNIGMSNNEYMSLRRNIEQRGLLMPDRTAYWVRVSWIVPIWLSCWALLMHAPRWPLRLFVLLLAAFVAIQGAALAHEAGHGALTSSRYLANAVGQCFMSLMMGSSYGSWLARHRAHHSHAGTRADPDMRAGLFSFTPEDAVAARGVAHWFTSRQHLLIWPLATLMGVSFKLSSLRYVISRARQTRIDQGLLAIHMIMWIFLPAALVDPLAATVDYALLTWFEGIYLAIIFLTNHLGHPYTPVVRQGCLLGRQAASARNLPDTWLMRNIFVGLNSHIEHHLFPCMSFTRLHQIRRQVRDACEANEIPYHQVSLAQAFAEFHLHNRAVANIAVAAQRSRRGFAEAEDLDVSP